MLVQVNQLYLLASMIGHPDPIRRSVAERREFWSRAALHEERVDVETKTLPPLTFARHGPRVAVCVTGQLRTMPVIMNNLKLNIVDAMGANTTDMFYVVDLEEPHRRVPKESRNLRLEIAQGMFSYTLSQFTHLIQEHGLEATALVSFREAASYNTDWTCILAFEKLQTCADLIERHERDVGHRYDFVVRMRTDMLITRPAQPAATLKRAVYMKRMKRGMEDMLGITHRDFLKGMFGMMRFQGMWPVPTPRPCQRCDSCEGWMEHSLLMQNATFARDGFLQGSARRCTNANNFTGRAKIPAVVCNSLSLSRSSQKVRRGQ